MPTPAIAIVRLVAVGLAALACAAPASAAELQRPAPLLEKIREFRTETWGWQRLMRVRQTRAPRAAERSSRVSYRHWVLAYWRGEAARARRRAASLPRMPAWLCIHRFEGPWNANTGNGYYGGLQMDISFQRGYGADLLRRKGRAHRWRPLEQIWVAERAYRSGRGFGPWPNTARRCGLL